MNHLSVEKQVLIINTIVKSLDDLIDILKVTKTLSEQIYSTILEILGFLQKVIHSLPELLVSDIDTKYKRSDLIDEFDQVFFAWEEFMDQPELFYQKYSEFSALWKNFETTLKRIEKEGTTIFLSMN